jgi:4'-phosphopantetheinyl transferase
MSQRFPGPNVLEVWPFQLLAPQTIVALAQTVLSEDELGRANRFLRQQSRDRFVLGRSVLRSLLALYLNTVPSAIEFSYNEHGKPALLDPAFELCFNLSHSADVAVIVLGRECRLGVDIQQEREISEYLQIAKRFFSPQEVRDLLTAPYSEQRHLFFECWARKEAFMKAEGRALSIPLNSFRVRFLPGDAPAVEIDGLEQDGLRQWSMHELNITPGFAGALVHDGAPRSVHIKDWVSIAEMLEASV